MTKARDIANLVDSNGDVVSGALDNVPASDNASALTTGTLPDGRFPATLPAISGANLTGVAPTKSTIEALGIDLPAANLTGTVPTSILSYASGDVIQQIHTSVQNHPHPSNTNGHIASDGNGHISETTSYSSSSLTPLLQLAVTKKITNSKLIVKLTGRFNITTGYRSQIALFDTYTAGQANVTNECIGYHHYGLYNATGGDFYTPGSYEYAITGINAGTTKTYYWFGGSIGPGTQKYWGLTMTITEIAT